jgi:glycosyltransferase involved in cell wall biosynthesis
MQNRKIRVAYAHDGKSIYDGFFLEHLNRKYDVCFLTFNREAKYVPEGVPIVEMPDLFRPLPIHDGVRLLSNTLFRSYLFSKYVHRIKPDVLIGCTALYYGFYSAFSNYKPFVLFVWGSDVLIYPKYPPLRFLAKYAIKKADAIVVDSEVQKEATIRLGGNPDKIVKFPWVDLQAFYNEKSSGREIRDQLGLNDNLVIISTRSLEPKYGIESLIDAVPKVVKEVENARFLIVGDGRLKRPIKMRIKSLNVEKYVKLLGFVEHKNIAKYLKAADVYVSTSFSDGTSASLLEAMACERPPVVTAIPGNKEWVSDKENGLLFASGNSEELANHIISLAKDKKLREKLGKRAFLTVKEMADWNKHQEILDKLICGLVK